MPNTRRAVLASAAAGLGFAGCLSGGLPDGEFDGVDGRWQMTGRDAAHTRRAEGAPADPTTVWGRELSEVRAVGTPALANGRLYVPADAASAEARGVHRLYSLSATTGETRWWVPLRVDLNDPPAISGDRVVITGKRSLERGRVACFESRYGEEEWLYDVDARLTAAPTVDAGVVYVPDWGGRVHALSVTDGSVLWTTRVEDSTDRGTMTVTTPAAVADGTVYVGSNSGRTGIVALDADTGAERWRAPTNPVVAGPVVRGDLLVVRTHELLVAYGTDGERRWAFNLLDSGYGPIAVDDGRVYAENRERLSAITHGGERSWTREVSGDGPSGPTVAGDRVLLRTEGRLTALAASTGDQAWETTVRGRGSVIATPEALFLPGDGRLFGLGER